MASRRRKLSKLIFPDFNEWTTKWVTRSILSTPKWQINAIQGSFYYNEYIDILAGKLDGLALPQRTDPSTNYRRSLIVGIGVGLASEEYEKNKIKVPSTVQNQFLKDLLEGPTVSLALSQSTMSPVANASYGTNGVMQRRTQETRPISEARKMGEPVQMMEPIIA
jgi:hypothetical protein